MKRGIDGDRVTQRNHIGRGLVEGQSKLFFDLLRQTMPIGIVEMHVERLQSAKHGKANPPGCDRTHMHSLDVVRAGHAVGDIPTALYDPLIGRNVVPHQAEDHHHHVLGDADRIAIGNLGHGNAALDRRLEIDVVRSDAGGDGEF